MRELAHWCAALLVAVAGALATGAWAQAPAPELPKGLFRLRFRGRRPRRNDARARAGSGSARSGRTGADAGRRGHADVARRAAGVPPLARVTDTAGVLGGGAKASSSRSWPPSNARRVRRSR